MSRFKTVIIQLFIFLLTIGNSIAASEKIMVDFPAVDKTYIENIRTVQFYPFSGTKDDALSPPIIPLTQEHPLILSFDELGGESRNLYAMILHCNRDWSYSNLASVQYFDGINENFITDRLTSFATRVSYTHYSYIVPPVKITGNFLLVVYEENDPTRVVLTRRFVVFENLLNLIPEVTYTSDVSTRKVNQQVNLVVNYSSYNLVNPQGSFFITMRQNHRWDKAIIDLPPLSVRESEKILDYSYFTNENSFKAGNEFRLFDIRSFRFGGINVDKVFYDGKSTEITLIEEESRNNRAYGLMPDINGKFLIENHESGDSETYPDYVNVHFFLKSEPVHGDVYVYGALTDWRIDEKYKLTYDPVRKRYNSRILLKQGYYNYEYVVVPKNFRLDEEYLEGSHSLTENFYDIIAYYRSPGTWTDLVIGYKNLRYLIK